MSKVSELISLPVYSIYDKCKMGNIQNILFDAREIRYYVVYNEDNDLEYLISPQNIYGKTNRAITIKNMSSATLLQNEESVVGELFNPINTLALDTRGQVYGRVKEVEVEGKKITRIVCEKNASPSEVMYFSKDITMLKASIKDRMAHFQLDKTPLVSDNRVVKVLDIAPQREIVQNNILIGRKTTQDIVGQNGEIIIKANTTITSKLLNKIKYSGKLKELTLHSK